MLGRVSLIPSRAVPDQESLPFAVQEAAPELRRLPITRSPALDSPPTRVASETLSSAEELFEKVKEILARMTTARTIAEVAADLGVSKSQANDWLQRLAKEGVLEKLSKPVRYRASAAMVAAI